MLALQVCFFAHLNLFLVFRTSIDEFYHTTKAKLNLLIIPEELNDAQGSDGFLLNRLVAIQSYQSWKRDAHGTE